MIVITHPDMPWHAVHIKRYTTRLNLDAPIMVVITLARIIFGSVSEAKYTLQQSEDGGVSWDTVTSVSSEALALKWLHQQPRVIPVGNRKPRR